VTSVAFSPDNKFLASGSDDSTIRVVELATGKEKVFKGHKHFVHSVAWHPDGKSIVSGSGDNTVRVWNVETKEAVEFEGHTKSVTCVAFDKTGDFIASASEDKTVRVWTVATKEFKVLEDHDDSVFSVSWSPTSHFLVSGSSDKTLRIWDVAAGSVTRTLEGHTDCVRSVAWSPDGQLIASGSRPLTMLEKAMPYMKVGIAAMKAVNGPLAALFGVPTPKIPTGVIERASKEVSAMDQESTVAEFDVLHVRIWDAESGEVVSVLEGHTSYVNSVAWDPTSALVVSGSADNTVRVWNVAAKAAIKTIHGHSDSVSGVAWSSDGTSIASGSRDNTAMVTRPVEIQAHRYQDVFKGHTEIVMSVAFSPDNKFLASGSDDKTIRVVELAAGKEEVFEGHKHFVHSVAWHPDGKSIVSGSGDNTVRVWNVETKEAVEFEGHTKSVTCVAFDKTGDFIASASEDKTVRVWTVATKEFKVLEDHDDSVFSVSWSPTSHFLVSGSSDKTLRIWDVAAGSVTRTLEGHTDCVRSVAWSPDGQLIASGSSDETGQLEKKAMPYMVEEWLAGLEEQKVGIAAMKMFGAPIPEIPTGVIERASKEVSAMDQESTVAEFDVLHVRIWDAESGEVVSVLEGHTSYVNSVAWDPTSALVVSGSADNTVRVWDVAAKAATKTIHGHSDSVSGVAWSSDGTSIASGSRDNTAMVTRPVEIQAGGRTIAMGLRQQSSRLVEDGVAEMAAAGGKLFSRWLFSWFDDLQKDAKFSELVMFLEAFWDVMEEKSASPDTTDKAFGERLQATVKQFIADVKAKAPNLLPDLVLDTTTKQRQKLAGTRVMQTLVDELSKTGASPPLEIHAGYGTIAEGLRQQSQRLVEDGVVEMAAAFDSFPLYPWLAQLALDGETKFSELTMLFEATWNVMEEKSASPDATDKAFGGERLQATVKQFIVDVKAKAPNLLPDLVQLVSTKQLQELAGTKVMQTLVDELSKTGASPPLEIHAGYETIAEGLRQQSQRLVKKGVVEIVYSFPLYPWLYRLYIDTRRLDRGRLIRMNDIRVGWAACGLGGVALDKETIFSELTMLFEAFWDVMEEKSASSDATDKAFGDRTFKQFIADVKAEAPDLLPDLVLDTTTEQRQKLAGTRVMQTLVHELSKAGAMGVYEVEVVVYCVLVVCLTRTSYICKFAATVDEVTGNASHMAWIVSTLILAIAFIAREAMQIAAAFKIDTASAYFSSFWNFVDLASASLAIATVASSLVSGPGETFNHLASVTVFFMWLKMLGLIKALNQQVATFVLMLSNILADIRAFLFVMLLVIIMFGHALFMVLGTRDEGVFPTTYAYAISVVFMFIIVIVMLNVLIAIVSDSYANAMVKSTELFWLARLELVAEVSTTFKNTIGRIDYKKVDEWAQNRGKMEGRAVGVISFLFQANKWQGAMAWPIRILCCPITLVYIPFFILYKFVIVESLLQPFTKKLAARARSEVTLELSNPNSSDDGDWSGRVLDIVQRINSNTDEASLKQLSLLKERSDKQHDELAALRTENTEMKAMMKAMMSMMEESKKKGHARRRRRVHREHRDEGDDGGHEA
ncbi:hypothetical protein TeGR_g2991, partial [Tetraparma gracilis]